MQRFPRTLAGVSVAVLAGSAIAQPVVGVATAQQTQPAQTSGLLDGLLDGLGDLLADLLGTSEQQQLQQLVDQLAGGQDPTGETLAPLTGLLQQLANADGLPAETRALVQQLIDLLESGDPGEALDPSILAPIASLLRQLADTQGLPAVASNLLDQLAGLLESGESPGLPGVGDLPLDPSAISGLADVLDALLRGEEPTGTLLAPVIPLLRQVAQTPGLPAEVRELVDSLIDALQTTTGPLDPIVASQLRGVLSLVGNTPGVTSETRTIIERTTTILDRTLDSSGGTGGDGRGGGGTPTPGGTPITPTTGGGLTGGGLSGTTRAPRRATKRDRAVVKRVTVNRGRTIAKVRVACPRSAPAVCTATVGAKLRGTNRRAVRRTVTTRIGQGKAKTVTLRIAPKARKQLRARGGRLKVNVTTRFVQQRFSASKDAVVKKRAR